MTSIPKDKEELRKNIRCTLGYCEVSEHGNCLFESSRNATQELDLIMQLFEAHKEQAVLEARIDELEMALSTKGMTVVGERIIEAHDIEGDPTVIYPEMLRLRLATLRSKGGK